MSDQLNLLREMAIPLPIPASFRQQAKDYASGYFTVDAQKRVYLQTLGLLVLDGYLRLLGFPTNLSQPERWNPVFRLWSEANELELPGYGYLQCCVIMPGQQEVIVTSMCGEGEHNSVGKDSSHIGCVFVEVAISEKTATLLGFVPGCHGEIAISRRFDATCIGDLQSIDDLIDVLSERELSSGVEVGQLESLTQEFAERKITFLRNWLNHIYEGGWEVAVRDLEAITCQKKLVLAGRIFTLQISVLENHDDLLLVRVVVQAKRDMLPMGMQVSVPDDDSVYTETVKDVADMISIPLELAAGEEFWVELRLQTESIREYFMT